MFVLSRFAHVLGGRQSLTTLVIEIGSSSVGVALALFRRDRSPHLVWTKREDFVFQEELDLARFVRSMQNTLESVLFAVTSDGLGVLRAESGRRTLDRIDVVFSAPWFTFETRHLRADFETPPRRLRAEVDALVRQAVAEGALPAPASAGESTASPAARSRAELIECLVPGVRVNGYKTRDMETPFALSLEVIVSFGAVSKDTLSRVRTGIGKALHEEHVVSFHSAASVLSAVIRLLFPETQNALVVHVGGEVTEVFSIRDGVLVETVSFPAGYRTLARTVALSTGAGLGEASSRLASASHQKTAPHAVSTPVRQAEGTWQGFFDQALLHLMQEEPLPRDVFVLAPEETIALFSGFVEREQFAQSGGGANAPFAVTPLRGRFLSAQVDAGPLAPHDFFLAATTIFLDDMLMAGESPFYTGIADAELRSPFRDRRMHGMIS